MLISEHIIKNKTSPKMAGYRLDRKKMSAISNSTKIAFCVENDKPTPTPLDFDAFIPWLCIEWQASKTVLIKRMNQEEHLRLDSKRYSSIKSKSIKNLLKKHDAEIEVDFRPSALPANIQNTISCEFKGTIPVFAYYDSRGYLVEIAIIGYRFTINRKLIQAFNVCLPFHSLLTKLTIRRGGLSQTILYEIAKLLPYSNLTDVCFDDSYVPQGNYYILLDQICQLKYLSLRRCSINDTVCKEIALRIDYGRPAAKTLQILDLTSNLITDFGIQFLGEALRRNRRLASLNVSSNKLTDDGASYILNQLKEFPLNCEEILEQKRNRRTYLENKEAAYKKCLEEINLCRQKTNDETSVPSLNKRQTSVVLKRSKSVKIIKNNILSVIDEQSTNDSAEVMTTNIVGQYEHPFYAQNVIKRDGWIYSVGNLTLCSLNLAYNNLSFSTVQKIHEVLRYQNHLVKSGKGNGLIRIVIDGNRIPTFCPQYDDIDMFLKQTLVENMPRISTIIKKRVTSVGRRIV